MILAPGASEYRFFSPVSPGQEGTTHGLYHGVGALPFYVPVLLIAVRRAGVLEKLRQKDQKFEWCNLAAQQQPVSE